MAELKKMQDYEYDLPELVDQPEQQMPDSSSNQEIILPQSPAKRLKQISALEKNCCGKRGDCYCCFMCFNSYAAHKISAELKKKSRQYKQKSMIKSKKNEFRTRKKRTFSY